MNSANHLLHPTRSLGINLSSEPCLRKTLPEIDQVIHVLFLKFLILLLIFYQPAVCCGLIPIPSSVIIADVAGDTLNSSEANFNTAVKGVLSGTLSLQL